MSDKQSRVAKKTAKPAAKKAAKAKAPARPTAPPPSEEEKALAAEQKPLSPGEELFAQAYLAKGLNATQAYLVVHPNAKVGTARTEGCRTLAKPHVARRVAELSAARAKDLEIEGTELLRHTHAVATADHRSLSEYRYFGCRYCNGLENRYQRTLAEYEADREKHQKAEWDREAKCLLGNKPFTPKEFDEKGGPGFNEWAEPAPECPNCFGHGVGRTVINDTSKLSPDAALLYAGMKEGKDGIEVKMHDKMKAQDMLFRHKGLFEADNAQLAKATSPESLMAMAEAMAASRKKQLETLEQRRGDGFTGD